MYFTGSVSTQGSAVRGFLLPNRRGRVRLLDASMAHDFKGCDFGGPRCFPKGHPGTTAGVFGTFWPAAGGGPYTLHRARHTAHMRAVCARVISEASLFSSCTPFLRISGFFAFCAPSLFLFLFTPRERLSSSRESHVESRQSTGVSGLRRQESRVQVQVQAKFPSGDLGFSAHICFPLSPLLLFSLLLASP